MATKVIRKPFFSTNPPDAVYIGRPSKWGNPFIIGKDGDRAEVIAKYEAWIKAQPELLRALPEIRGKTLMCFCKPHACHGDVLAKLADEST
jgi:hypothetical protein